MPAPTNRIGRRGLLAVVLLVVALAVVADLLRSDSLILSLWSDVFGARSVIRGFLDELRTRGPGGWGR